METDETSDENILQNDENDIFDSSVFGPAAKLFSCSLCDQKFTNKVSLVKFNRDPSFKTKKYFS